MLSSIRTCYDDGDCQDMKGGEGSTHVVRKHERMVRSVAICTAEARNGCKLHGRSGYIGLGCHYTTCDSQKTKKVENNVFKKAKSYSTDDGSTGTESVERAALGFLRYVTYTFSVVEVKRAKIDRK